jgi:PHD/YefM family antitoxin component YafN of YafNO toxin-antitoxin module
MLHVDDIYSLTDFQRHAKEHIERLKQTGRPEVLTVNGKAELVVQDAAAYQKLLDLLDRAEALEGIRQGLESMHRGKGRPAVEVFQELRKKHHIPHDV